MTVPADGPGQQAPPEPGASGTRRVREARHHLERAAWAAGMAAVGGPFYGPPTETPLLYLAVAYGEVCRTEGLLSGCPSPAAAAVTAELDRGHHALLLRGAIQDYEADRTASRRHLLLPLADRLSLLAGRLEDGTGRDPAGETAPSRDPRA